MTATVDTVVILGFDYIVVVIVVVNIIQGGLLAVNKGNSMCVQNDPTFQMIVVDVMATSATVAP